MRQRLLDTQKAEELGPDGTGTLEGSWVVTTYTNEEWIGHGLKVYPTDTTFIKADSWPDFNLKFSNDNHMLWEWETSSDTYQIQYYAHGFGKAPCRHTAVIMVSGEGNVYYLCDRFRASNADMSSFTAVIGGSVEYPFTTDTCLGKTCKIYQMSKGNHTTLENHQIPVNRHEQYSRDPAPQVAEMMETQHLDQDRESPINQGDTTKVETPAQSMVLYIAGDVNYTTVNKTNISIIEKLSLIADKLFGFGLFG